jgi:hypothetical protein
VIPTVDVYDVREGRSIRRPAVGFWWSDDEGNARFPRAQDAVDLAWDQRERELILGHLQRGRIAGQCRGISDCRICGLPNGSADMTDGVFVWPEGFTHYINAHGVRPPEAFVDHVFDLDSHGVSLNYLGSLNYVAHEGDPIYGGAAAQSSIPVSEGGRYHPPAQARAGRVAPLSNCVLLPGHPLYADFVELERSGVEDARSGQITTSDAEIQALVQSLNGDFDAFAVQVCGPSGARGVGCDAPTGIDQAFVARWRALLEQWRAFRDSTREEWHWFASPQMDRIRQFRADLVRLQTEFSTRTGEATIAPTQEREGPLEQLADRVAGGAGDFLADLAVPLGIGLVVLGLVVVSSR